LLLLGPNILLKSPFSNTLILPSSLNVSDQVSHPDKTTGKIINLYILISKYFYSRLVRQEILWTWHLRRHLFSLVSLLNMNGSILRPPIRLHAVGLNFGQAW
jgi:hypothetical protein